MLLIRHQVDRRSPSRRVAQHRWKRAGSETGAPMVRVANKFCRSGRQSAPYSAEQFEPTHVGCYEVTQPFAHFAPFNADWIQYN